MSQITFVLFSYNEEKRIGWAIRNLLPYGEVLIMDGGSTDRTKEISEKLGAKFFKRPEINSAYVETHEMFSFVKQQVKTKWLYWGYVDNLLPKTLLEKISEVSKQDIYKYVHIPVYTYLWGEINKPVIKASYACFFVPEFMDFQGNKMHGMGKFIGTKEQMLELPHTEEMAIRHFSLYDLNKFVTGHLKYAEAEALQKYENGKRFSVVYLIGSSLRYFWLFYKRGFKLGAKGFYISLLYAFFRVMVSVRLYEIEHNLNLENIEKEYSKAKEALVVDVENKK